MAKPYTAAWILNILKQDNYSEADYRRFQSELRYRKKYGLLEMFQRLLKQKTLNEKIK